MENQPVTLDAWSKDDYTEVAVAYLDMVGFSDYLRKDGTGVRDVLGWLDELDRELSELRKRIYAADQLKSAISSDAMLRALPIRHGIPNTLNTLVSDVIRVQRRLTKMRWENGSKCLPVLPLRGGISVGNLCWRDDRHIFGEALVKAADLEERVAGWPRVVIDPEIAMDSDDERRWWPSDLADIFTCGADGLPLFRVDEGIRYLNYLAPIQTHGEWSDWQFYNMYLAGHKDLIMGFRKNAKTDKQRGQVLCWAEYHNSIVRLLKEDRHASSFFNKKELLIEL